MKWENRGGRGRRGERRGKGKPGRKWKKRKCQRGESWGGKNDKERKPGRSSVFKEEVDFREKVSEIGGKKWQEDGSGRGEREREKDVGEDQPTEWSKISVGAERQRKHRKLPERD